MAIYKTKDVYTNVNVSNINVGDIGANFYSEDENTASIRIFIKWNNEPLDLNKTKLTPKLDLFMQDGSVFIDESYKVINPVIGLIQYDIPKNVIKHIGQVSAKLFLESEHESVHVANFSFNILDSGVENKIAKEVSVNLVKDTVKGILREDVTDLLNGDFKAKLTTDLQNYLNSNASKFKGPKGDTGEQGPAGQDGKDGKNGINGIDGINGNPGPQGPPGRDGKDGVNGKDGVDGKSFDFASLTDEQKAEITPKLPDFSNWQQYKLTNDDGTLNSITAEVDMNMMTSDIFTRTGFNYCSNIKNAPNGGTNKGYINVYIQSDTIGYAFYKDYNSSSIYTNYKYGKNWQGWILINPRGQMTKITNDNGFSFYIDSIDFNDLSGFASNHTTGFFCSNNLKNTPNGYTSGSILLVRTFNEVNKMIYTNPFNNDIYINTSLNNKWSRWRKVVSEDYDTGWIPLPLTNGASPDTYSSSYLPISYRVITQGESKRIQIIGNIKNLSTGLVFSQLPNNIAPVKTIEYKLNQRTSSNNTLAYISNDGAMKVVGTADSNSTYMINLTYVI
ncbi:BppU family phage baseplate upper protein [Staphylococcus capitis]|uniref:BppU family phage baseplate upper protein n=1 Tax=Staphylococcus capitis TaxID=29388 RepID=UPI0036BEF113